MKSNFAFLKSHFPVLANFGILAEKYCYSDSNSCIMKLGMIGETIVNLMLTYDKIKIPPECNAVTKIKILSLQGLLTPDLSDILHALRKARNKAAHTIMKILKKAKRFWKWHIAYANGLCRPMVIGSISIVNLLCLPKQMPNP